MRVGIFGFGVWSPNLCRNLANHADLAWIVDPSEAAQQRARDAGYVSRSAPDWDAVDAVAIATPIATHAPLAMEAMSRGKHVLCEKPVGVSLDEAEMLVRYARHRGLTLMADHTWTAHAGVLRCLGGEWFSAKRWASDQRGFDPLLDLLPHDASLLRIHRKAAIPDAVVTSVYGLVTEVTARYGELLDRVSYCYASEEKVRTVVTDRGVNDGSLLPDDPEPIGEIARAFVEACRTGNAPEYGSPDEILYVARVIDAAIASRTTGGDWVQP